MFVHDRFQVKVERQPTGKKATLRSCFRCLNLLEWQPAEGEVTINNSGYFPGCKPTIGMRLMVLRKCSIPEGRYVLFMATW